MRSSMYRQNVVRAKALSLNGPTQISAEFPLGPGYYRMDIRLNVALTIGTGAGVVAEGILNFLRQINLQTSLGEVVCRNVPARALFKLAIQKSRTVPRYNEIVAANGTYRINIPIFFADPTLQRPEDLVLNTSRYTSIVLDLVTGPLTDLLTAPGTASVVLTADVDVWRSKGRWPTDAPLVGVPFYGVMPVVDAAAQTYIDLERGPDLRYRRLLLQTVTGGTAGSPFVGANSDAIIDVLNLRDSDDNYVKDNIWAALQDDNKIAYASEAVPAGFAFVDFIRDGSVLSSLYSGDKSMLKLEWTNQSAPAALSNVSCLVEGYRNLKQVT